MVYVGPTTSTRILTFKIMILAVVLDFSIESLSIWFEKDVAADLFGRNLEIVILNWLALPLWVPYCTLIINVFLFSTTAGGAATTSLQSLSTLLAACVYRPTLLCFCLS